MHKSICNDRVAYYWRLASTAANAHRSGNTAGACGVVKKLKSSGSRLPKVVKMEDGSLSTTEEMRVTRMQKHFTEAMRGTYVGGVSELGTAPITISKGNFHISPYTLELAIRRLGAGKGLGPDAICAELLQAGGAPLAIRAHELCCKIILQEKLPIEWKGGRLVDLFKSTGELTDPDCTRGLLISDHLGKAFITTMKDSVMPQYVASQPNMQCGDVPKKGTDIAHHFVLSIIDYSLHPH